MTEGFGSTDRARVRLSSYREDVPRAAPLSGALTRREHDRIVNRKGRPVTQGPIARRSAEQPAPDGAQPAFGYHIEKAK